ncbi:MAG TPA: hypothetical protein VMY87_05205 [Armatimonadota bacterium]|nr:hypothetical protein [Armatimonadota bacterium]
MLKLMRRAAAHLAVLAVVLLMATAACAQTKWPSLFKYTVSLSSEDTARYQLSAGLSGPIAENMSAKIDGWWIGGTEDNRAFVGDAYVDFDRSPIYLAAGRKYIVFGPAGVLVSPGLYGGELKLDISRWELHVISGSVAFTPGTGATRFTYAGNRAPSDESMTAVRLAVPLTSPEAAVPVKVGGNWIDILDESGTSVDVEIGALPWLTLYGEAADYDDSNAHVYGLRLSDAAMRDDGKAWILVYYHREIEVGFVPAQVGASAYFEGQDGWAGGLYYQMNTNHAIGIYADGEEAILTWFGTIPL